MPTTNTSIPIPCNRAEFAGDVTIPDGTQIATGASFTKIWRLRNTGTCTWTSGYVLFFDHGDPMDAPTTQSLTSGEVLPGAVVEVSVTLRAPAIAGTYQSHFRLRSPDNIVFGIGNSGQDTFWVKINVLQPTVTPTNTPIPPDFEQIVHYAGGGGGASCGVVYPGFHPAFETAQNGHILQICIWGARFGLPFSLEFTPPTAAMIQPINLFVDDNTLRVRWDEYELPDAFASREPEATVMAINAWIPINFPAGEWKIQATGAFQAESSFMIEKGNYPPYIEAVNPSHGSEFSPFNSVFLANHLLKLKENGRVNVIGTDFPANTPVYVVLYRKLSDFQYSLVNTQTVYSNFLGSIFIELLGEVNVGQTYLIVAAIDPHTHMTIENDEFDVNLPHDLFTVIAP